MSFQPVIPAAGLVGWRFLDRTMDAQQTVHEGSRAIRSDSAYFAANIGAVNTAEHLVSDRRLLSVALGAFGLSDDIGNRFFIRKILEDGTARPDALANRLSDSRYKALADAFGFGDLPVARTQLSGFADEIIERFHRVGFEAAVGDQDNDMRLALNAERELKEIAASGQSADAMWFRVMGNPPLRQVFQTALGLPDSFAGIDLDRQLDVFREKSAQQLGAGEVAAFSDPDKVTRLIERFLLRGQLVDTVQSGGSVALTLLQSARIAPPPLLPSG